MPFSMPVCHTVDGEIIIIYLQIHCLMVKWWLRNNVCYCEENILYYYKNLITFI